MSGPPSKPQIAGGTAPARTSTRLAASAIRSEVHISPSGIAPVPSQAEAAAAPIAKWSRPAPPRTSPGASRGPASATKPATRSAVAEENIGPWTTPSRRQPASRSARATAAPVLLDVELRHGGEVLRERIGLREIRTEGTRILLNGEDLVLCCVCVHEDDPLAGRCTDEADIARRIAHARELGANFLRLAHYPHDKRVARRCDEAGLLLWAEIPVYWAIAFDNPATLADAGNQLAELIARDANRASIILWGIGNENADSDARLAFMASLAQAARAADPSRLVTAACRRRPPGTHDDPSLARQRGCVPVAAPVATTP